MLVTINGKPTVLTDAMTPDDLFKERDIQEGAIWVNGKQLLRAEYPSYQFQENDQIKILRLLAGG